MYWQCSGSCRVLVGHHEEVEDLFVLLSHYLGVNDGTWSRINNVSVKSLEESRRHSFVNEYKKQSRIVIWLELLNGLTKLPVWTLQSQTVLLHRRTANSIPINHDLLWSSSSIHFFVVCECIFYELLKLVCSVFAKPLFLLVL